MSRPLKKSEMNHFLPGGIGIETPHPHDILSGRGGASNNHMGNKIYRTVCEHNKGLYAAAPRNEKLPIAVRIVEAVRSRYPPGRFLERRKEDKLWYEVTERRAIDKTAQALREKVHKAIMLPLEEIPEDFAHLVGEDTEAAALAAAAASAAAASAPKPKAAAAAATKKRKSTGGTASSRGKAGKKKNGGNKKVKLDDERFALPSKLRNISFGGFFQSSGSGSAGSASAGAEPVAGSRSDTTGSLPSMPPLPGAGMEPPLANNSTHTDSNLLVETALAPSTSLFNFFGLLGRGTSTSGDNGGKIAAAAAAAAAATAGDGGNNDDNKPAASASAAASSGETFTASLEKSPRNRAKCLTAATADARAVVETQAAVRETSLTRDISSFLPSFLERGLTGLVATATSLGTGISGVFSGSSGDSMSSPRRNVADGGGGVAGGDNAGCISQITQGEVGAAAAAPASSAIGVGHDDLVVPPPPSGGLNRGNTLTGDDDFEEDPSLERLRMIPPSLSGPQQNDTVPMSMSIPSMPADDRKKSSLL